MPSGPFAGPEAVLALPTGFHSIRHFGLFANHQRRNNLARVRVLLGEVVVEPAPDEEIDKPPSFVCRTCGTPMIIIETLVRSQRSRAPP